MPNGDDKSKTTELVLTSKDYPTSPAPKLFLNTSNTIESKGNSDAKLLAKAFEEYSQGGMTPAKREKIEKLDDILKDADIVISKDGTFATIAQEDGATFKVTPKGGRGGK